MNRKGVIGSKEWCRLKEGDMVRIHGLKDKLEIRVIYYCREIRRYCGRTIPGNIGFDFVDEQIVELVKQYNRREDGKKDNG